MELQLNNLCSSVLKCNACRLNQTRIKPVCPEGIVPNRIMFIAQAPGRLEDKEGKMFIGPSGKIFDQLTNSCGISRNEIYLTNLVKCFLPNCRKPRTDEIETCNSLYLSQEMELAKPEIIVTLGFHVTKFIFNEYKLYVPNRIGFKSLFGNLFVSQNTKIIPLHHPATVVLKSKSYDSLEKEYQILKTIQHSCNLIGTCFKFNEYKQGLLPVDFAEKYCFGNWLSCQYKKRTE